MQKIKMLKKKTKGEFRSDLQDGEQVEQYFYDFIDGTIGFKDCYHSTKQNREDFDWAFLFSLIYITFEIKLDDYSGTDRDRFGNSMFIETCKGVIDYVCDEKRKKTYKGILRRDKETGLSITKAKYWVQYFSSTDEFWIIKTSTLRQLVDQEINKLIDSNKEFCRYTKSGFIGYLIPKRNIKYHFYIFKRNDPNVIINILRLKELFNE